jgi:hypothetical protein
MGDDDFDLLHVGIIAGRAGLMNEVSVGRSVGRRQTDSFAQGSISLRVGEHHHWLESAEATRVVMTARSLAEGEIAGGAA